MQFKKLNIKRILVTILWVIIGAGTIVLSVAAVKRQNAEKCSGIEIRITGVNSNFFIDKADVLKIVNENTGGDAKGKPIASFNLRNLETLLKKDVWINNAELFFDNNSKLQVGIEEREPIARIFTVNNSSFYIDSSATMLPLSDKFSARLPVFTGFLTDAKVLSRSDSNVLLGIRKISIALQADSFLMAMIDQVDITSERQFEMTPKIGDQAIIFGDAGDVNAKLSKLKLFYRDVILRSGWNRYSTIDLQYKNQVVAKIKGKEDVAADSIHTLQLMDFMARNAALMASDSARKYIPEPETSQTDVKLIQHSEERDEGPEMTEDNFPMAGSPLPVLPGTIKPVAKAVPAKIAMAVPKPGTKKAVTKPTAKKPVIVKNTTGAKKLKTLSKPVQRARILMPRKNDY